MRCDALKQKDFVGNRLETSQLVLWLQLVW